MMPDGSSSTAGFTLLEVLVALVILGFIVTGLAQGSRLGLAAWDRQSRAIDHDATLDSTSRTLRTLIEGMLPGGGPLQPAIAGDAHTLVLTAPMPAAAPIGPMRLADIALGVDAHQLVLRWVPHLHAHVLSPPPPRSDVLLGGVSGVDFNYFGASAATPGPAGWVTHWSDVNPPSLIRVHIRFVAAGQNWPDLIVAPMRRFDDE